MFSYDFLLRVLHIDKQPSTKSLKHMDFLAAFRFPVFSTAELSDLQDSLQNLPFPEAIKKSINQELPFTADGLSICYQLLKDNACDVNDAAIFVLRSSVSFLQKEILTGSHESYPLLLQSLARCKISKDYNDLVHNMFQFLLSFLGKSIPLNDIKECLFDYFTVRQDEKADPTIMEELINIVTHFVSDDGNISDEGLHLLDLIIETSKSFTWVMPENCRQQLVRQVMPVIIKLRPSSFTVLKRVLALFDGVSCKEVISVALSQIVKVMENGTPAFELHIPEDKEVIELELSPKDHSMFLLKEKQTFVNGFVPAVSELPTDLVEIPEKFRDLVGYLKDVCDDEDVRACVVNLLADALAVKGNVVDLIAFITFFVDEFAPSEECGKVTSALFDSVLFDSRLSLLAIGEEKSLLLRNRVYSLLLRNLEFCFENVIVRVARYPVTLCELLSYLAAHVDSLEDASVMTYNKFLEGLEVIAGAYRNVDEVDSRRIEMAENVSQHLACLLQKCLEIKSLAQQIFQSVLFAPVFVLSYVFDHATRGFLISSIENAHRSGISMATSVFPTLIIALLKCDAKGSGFELWCDGLALIVRMIEVEPELIADTEHLIGGICAFLDALPESNITNPLLLLVTKFYAKAAESQELSEIVGASLSRVMKVRAISDNESEETELAKTMQNIVTAGGTDVIKQAGMCQPLICAFLNSPLLPKQLQFLIDLCQQSEENTQACHAHHLDVFLLELLNEKKSEECDVFVNLVQTLLVLMAHVSASTQVVCSFMSLFTPVETGNLSRYHYRFVDCLRQIGSKSRVRGNNFVPLGCGASHIRVSGLKPSLFSENLILLMKVHPAPGKPFDIVSFDAGINNRLDVSVDSTNVIHVEVVVNGLSHEYSLQLVIPNEKVDFSITIEPRTDEMSRMLFTIKDKTFGPLEVVHPCCSGDSMLLAIGHTTHTASYRLYSFELLAKAKTLLEAKAIVSKGRIDIASTGYKVELIGDCEADMAFADVLASLCSVELLFPLFAQLNIPIDGDGKHNASRLVSLLSTYLAVGERAERHLLSDGLLPIAFLMLEMPCEQLTVDLFNEWVLLYRKLALPQLRSEVQKHVLLNFGLWRRAPISVLVEVSRIWNESGALSHAFSKSVAFQDIIFALSEFFSLDSFEESDGVSVRQNVLGLARRAFENNPSETSLETAIGQCLIPANAQEKCEMLALIKDLVPMTPTEMLVKCGSFIDLHHLLVSPSDDIVCNVLDIFILLHKTGYFTDEAFSLQKHASVIVSFLVLSRSESFMTRLLERTEEYNELLVLCFHMALTGDSSVRQALMDRLPSSVELTSDAMVRLILCFLKSDDEFREFLELFVWNSSFVDLRQMLALVGVCAECQKMDSRMAQRCFIEVSLKLLNVVQNRDAFLRQLIDVIVYFILYQNIDYLRPDLPSSTDIASATAKDKHQFIRAVLDQERKVRFGLNFDDNGNWNDAGLAKSCMTMIIDNGIHEYYNTVGCFAYFLQRSQQGDDVHQKIWDQLAPEIRNCFDKKSVSDQWFSVLSGELESVRMSFERDMPIVIRMCRESLVAPNDVIRDLFMKADGGNADAIGDALREYETYKQKIEEAKHEGRKKWCHLWNHLAFDGPWKCRIASETYVRHWKRDSTLCDCGYPAKLKVNNDFQDHLFESLIRDAGSNKKAETMRQQLMEQKKQPLLPEIMQLSDSKVKTNVEADSEEPKRLILEYKVEIRKIEGKKAGRFRLYSNRIQIVLDESNRVFTFVPRQIRMILARGILHRPRGMEIFRVIGNSMLVEFYEDVFPILKRISELKLFSKVAIQTIRSIDFFRTTDFTEKWINREISNFEYLMHLNTFSGRTFNDSSLYPVFPWVIKDYSSETIDLDSDDIYRDLSKPMAAMSEERVEALKTRCLPPDEHRKGKYLYNSCYSSPLFVFIWLIRMEPFTTLHIKAQGGRFDHATRLFQSIKTSYELASGTIGDYRELIPEFFFDPTFLLNTNRFDLGKIGGEPLDHAVLPPWCKDNNDFIYLNRKALESEHVSKHLADWIDLIWGFKQNGEEAVKCDNIFYPYLYETVWDNPYVKLRDNRIEVEATLESCGHIPQKLFNERHPARNPIPSAKLTQPLELNLGINDICFVSWKGNRLICCTPSRMVSFDITFRKTNKVDASVKWKSKIGEWKDVSVISEKEAVFLMENDTILSVTDSKTCEIPVTQESYKILCVAACRDFVIFGGRDASINICCRKPPFTDTLHMFPSFHDEIVCCDINSRFDIAVAGTRDNQLFFLSPSRSTVNCIVSLENRKPVRMLITDGWGFVVVYEEEPLALKTARFVEVFSVNGKLVRRVEIPFSIEKWACWKSREGFDFLIVSSNREIQMCEVFYLEFSVVEKSAAESLCCSAHLGVVFAVRNGKVVLLPLEPSFRT